MTLEPLTYFRVIRRAERGSSMRMLRAVRCYCREGVTRYLNQFRARATT
jgi:hypothetical protein